MTQKSGFFDSLLVGGVYDRLYSAGDYCDNLATVIKNGVRYSPADDLKVTAAGGMNLAVSVGRAWIEGHYFFNDSIYTGLSIATAPTGSNSRIDRVVVRMNKSVSERNIVLAVKTGTAAANPEPPELTRAGDIYEICIAEIRVKAGQVAIANSDITDTRENETICGWAASVTPAIMSMLRKYSYRTVLAAATNTVEFHIPQYRADDVHILEVYTNGIAESAGKNYTINNNVITFAGMKQPNTEIEVHLYKSIDGTGLESVADQLEELQATIAALQGDSDYVYICNGVNDNVKLSQLAQSWLNGGTDYGSKKIRIVGTFGATAPHGGSGTSSAPYYWIAAGTGGNVNRKIILDFSSCGEINLPITAGTYNTIFYGYNVHIIGANVICNQTGAGTVVKGFSTTNGAIRAEHCRFWLTCHKDSLIAVGGTFVNCRGSVANVEGNSYCFSTYTNNLLRLEGGEFYAYTGAADAQSAIVGQSAANAVSILFGVNAPTLARSGFYQTNSVLQWVGGGILNCTDLVSALPMITVTGISNIRGTIEKSKAGAM